MVSRMCSMLSQRTLTKQLIPTAMAFTMERKTSMPMAISKKANSIQAILALPDEILMAILALFDIALGNITRKWVF